MLAFLNEGSIGAHTDLRNGLQFFWQAATELQNAEAKLYRDSSFFFTAEFARQFNALTFPSDPALKLPPDIRSRLREVAFSERFWKCWRPNRVSDSLDEFMCDIQNATFRNTSICEAAEMKLQRISSDVGILSAKDSVYAETPMFNVTKVSLAQRVELRNADSLALVRRWMANERGYYDPDSNVAPKDFQTVLEKDSNRFRRTKHFWNVAGMDRRIYLETETGRFFYVDEGHPGRSAHLEVFGPDHKHIGEAHIGTGVVDPSKKDMDKCINL
jgi:hypothetical protein